MRELIHLQVGQCGNQMGTMFWDKICQEHGMGIDGGIQKELTPEETQGLQVYFNITDTRVVPRAIIIDLECGTGEAIRKSEMGLLFSPDNIINGIAIIIIATNGAGNNFAKGFFTEGVELIDQITERIRKESESCENLQGFQIAHSSGGGTGSGLGSLIVSSLRDEYSEKILTTFTVFPSKSSSDVVVEPYNATLTMQHLIESASSTVCLDNGALTDICQQFLKVTTPSYDDLNKVVSDVMCGITSCVRFPGQLNSDMRKLTVNLTPFPRLHFFASSIAPLSSFHSQQYRSLNAVDVITQMFDSKNMLTKCDPSSGKYLAVAAILRGNLSTKEVENQMANFQKKHEKLFVDWIPNNVLTATTNVPPINSSVSGTFIGNTTSVKEIHYRIRDSCDLLYKKRAFLHWYTGEGMDTDDITEAISSVTDLIAAYEQIEKDETLKELNN